MWNAILNIQLQFSMAVLLVLLLRQGMKRMPKIYSYLLWVLVFARLLVPFSIESSLAVMPQAETIKAQLESLQVQGRFGSFFAENSKENTGAQKNDVAQQADVAGDAALSGMENERTGAAATVSDLKNAWTGADATASAMENALSDTGQHEYSQDSAGNGSGNFATEKVSDRVSGQISVGAAFRIGGVVLWLLGVLSIFAYNLVAYIRLYQQVMDARELEKGVYKSKKIRTPFTLGLLHHRIYLPESLSEAEQAYIICHERVHIRRKDNWVKLTAFLLATICWVNPLVWVAFHFMEQDMEMSCDEAVIRSMGTETKRSYSQSLLDFASGDRYHAFMPLGFGEISVKQRIKNLLIKKNTKRWVQALGVLILLLAAVLFFTRQESGKGKTFLLTNRSGQSEAVLSTEAVAEQAAEQSAQEVEKQTSEQMSAQEEQTEEQQQLSELRYAAEVRAFAGKWAIAFCDGSAETLVEMMTEEVQQHMEEAELLETGSAVSKGGSDPWPLYGEVTQFELEPSSEQEKGMGHAVILYYAWTQEPHMAVWREELTIGEDADGTIKATEEQLRYLNAICSKEEMQLAYPDGDIGNAMNYANNAWGETLNRNAQTSSSMAYRDLFEPDGAAACLLNLLDNPNKVELTVEEEEEQVAVVKIHFFEDGETVWVSMLRPWGTDGIWIPSGWSDVAVSGHGVSDGTWSMLGIESDILTKTTYRI
jgi:beta-lactamase regulating signal transducer with metallopeptidase domain